ncbi:MAG: selenide, water dikinase SelD, partial [Thermodesulfobacteriota bacterium]
KPLGTGIVNTAIKGGVATPELVEKTTRLMAQLNMKAAGIMAGHEVHACTDITGFGLIGHLAEMVTGSGKSILLNSSDIPVMPEAVEFASMGMVPAGAYKNRQFRECMTRFAPRISPATQDIFFDPQTSGGLLICCPSSGAGSLLSELRDSGISHSAIVGRVISDPSEKIFVE